MSCKRTARRPRPRATVRIESLAYGGDAVARDGEGRVVFVEGGAPGDELEVTIVEERKGWARGELARIRRPGEPRVEPPCPHFAAGCGGCQWQHVDVGAQRAAKEEIVRRALRRVAPPDRIAPIAAPAPDYGWRRRARLHVSTGQIGYRARRSHRLVDVESCPQLEPPLDEALQAIRRELLPSLDGAGDLELLLGGRGDVHVALRGRAADPAHLLGQAGIVGVGIGLGVGVEYVDLADDDLPFLARADVFAQASAAGNGELRRLVREAAGEGTRALELHAGSGNFTRELAARYREIVAVEEGGAAVELGRRNLALRGLDERVTWRVEPAERAVRELADAGAVFDVVLLDPPRTGIGSEAAARLATLAPRIVYVSCDPNTLARDLEALVAAGAHEVERVAPLDLMPQTFHVETVVTLRRR
jgi:23S rRNA (uracil1939-C5)-methyltransferase